MNMLKFTTFLGFLFLVMGLAGFFPSLVDPPHWNDPNLPIDLGYGRLFGLFPVNILHNFIHLGIGLWALAASQDLRASQIFCRFSAIFFVLLTFLGLSPASQTLFGLVPLFGHNLWLHAGTALICAFFGFLSFPMHHSSPTQLKT